MDEQLISVVARQDAALGLLMSILIDRGVISAREMSEALDMATEVVTTSRPNPMITSVFETLKTLIEPNSAQPVQ